MLARPRKPIHPKRTQTSETSETRKSPGCKTEHLQNHTKRPCSELATTSTGCAHGFSALGLDMAKQQNHQGMKWQSGFTHGMCLCCSQTEQLEHSENLDNDRDQQGMKMTIVNAVSAPTDPTVDANCKLSPCIPNSSQCQSSMSKASLGWAYGSTCATPSSGAVKHGVSKALAYLTQGGHLHVEVAVAQALGMAWNIWNMMNMGNISNILNMQNPGM